MQLEEGFWMRWSDDYGSSFAGGRVVIPVRRTEVDRTNCWGGATIGAFSCDKPQVIDGRVFFAFQKTPDGNGESYGSEVFLMRSADLVELASGGRMAEATWETLPRGEKGLQTERGLRLGEEPHLVQVSWDLLLARSLVLASSASGGLSWDFWTAGTAATTGRHGAKRRFSP